MRKSWVAVKYTRMVQDMHGDRSAHVMHSPFLTPHVFKYHYSTMYVSAMLDYNLQGFGWFPAGLYRHRTEVSASVARMYLLSSLSLFSRSVLEISISYE